MTFDLIEVPKSEKIVHQKITESNDLESLGGVLIELIFSFSRI